MNELKKIPTPKKLWVLRLYIVLLTFIVAFLLVAYVLISIYNLIASDNPLGDLVLGYTGIYLVWTSLAILFAVQVVSLFLNIHDNIEDIRNKTFNTDFSIDLDEEMKKNKDVAFLSISMIVIIILSIIFSVVNFNKINDNSNQDTSKYEQNYEDVVPRRFN